jgi:hypothetical protein
MEAQSFTRQQLYELVWKEPIEKLAPKFGLSDRGLAKLCERHAVPTPPRGYWARKQAGQKVVKAPLIQLEGSRVRDDYEIARFSLPKASATPADDAPDPLMAFYAEQLSEIGKIAVTKTLANPHAVIAQWLKDDERQRAVNARWGGPSFGLLRMTALDRRRLRLLSALWKTLEARGVRIECRRGTHIVSLRHEQDEVSFDIKEYVQQKRRPLNEDEIARGWADHSKYRVEQIPSGLLRGKVDTWLPKGIPTLWTESEERPFEDMLGEVAASILTALAQAKARREQREAAERRRWEEQEAARRREEAEKAEQKRREALLKEAKNWRRARELREYVRAVQTARSEADDDAALGAWSHWALACADELDPLIQAVRAT